MVNSVPRQNIRQCREFFSSFLTQVSHFSKCRPDTNPVPFQACNVILHGIKRKHIYLSSFLPLCSLSVHPSLPSPQFCPYLMQFLSPARTVLTHWNWIEGGAFHFQHLHDQRFGFNLSGHQIFLWILSGQKGRFPIIVPCHYCHHELLTGDKLSKGWPASCGDSDPSVALIFSFEESKVGTLWIDFLWISGPWERTYLLDIPWGK